MPSISRITSEHVAQMQTSKRNLEEPIYLLRGSAELCPLELSLVLTPGQMAGAPGFFDAVHEAEDLPASIRCTGLVVGTVNHDGIDVFNNEPHCIGWNVGCNALSFVLVDDVAAAILLACRTPIAIGSSYNLVGDVRLSAREFIVELARVLRRPIHCHPKRPDLLCLQELFDKWLVKRAGGRLVSGPTRRDLLSRGFMASFDCNDAKRHLGWQPTSDCALIARGIGVHAPPPPCR
jgi:hypothetical protein